MQPDKIKKLKSLIEMTNFGMTKADFTREFKGDFLKAIKSILDHLGRVEKGLSNKIDIGLANIEAKNNTQYEAIQGLVGDFKEENDTRYHSLKKDQENGLKSIQDRVRWMLRGKQGESGNDGSPGKDADEEKIVKEVLNKIEIPEKEIGIDDVGNLRNELEEIRKIKGKGGGGGVSAMGVAQAAKWIVHTEEPVGDIDGTNKAFTVSKPRIFAVLSMSLNGEFIAQLPNYTIAGNTITFSEAIPAAYDGKDWEIVYI